MNKTAQKKITKKKKDVLDEDISQQVGLKRNTIDKFYTKQEVVSVCLNYFKQFVNVNEADLIIEPSAGDGAFISEIKSICINNMFYDLAPEHKDVQKQDYLNLDYSGFMDKYKSIHVIGNPPFGRQSSLAIKFIKKSCEFCNTIAFILPKSFKKDSLKKTFPSKFHLIFESDVEDNAFLVDGHEHNVPCVFQIWEKKDIDRNVVEKIEPKYFKFVKKDEQPHISCRRVGVNAGTIDENIENKSVQSHYFIQFTNNKPISENISKLKHINYDFNNTVGPKSISKQELILKFNPLLD